MNHSFKISRPLRIGGLFILLFIISLASIPSISTAQAQALPCSRKTDFKKVHVLGQACKRPDGMWVVMHKDGTISLTHGPDPAPGLSEMLAASSALALAAPSPLTCAPANTYRARVLYARPTDRADQYAARLGTIRSYIQGMQDALNNESMIFGVSSSYRVACDADGQVTVQNVALSLTSAQNNISDITNDLKAKGFNSTFDKYIIIYEQPACGGGVAWAETNDALDVNNNANRGPSYGISWGFCGYATVMHENAHNMGAVMNSAPNTTSAGHCIDDQDVMCYNDGGPRGSQLHVVCTDFEHFDCNHDDYFHPSPPAGSYLATHWNIANCINRFIQRSGCSGTQSPYGGAAWTIPGTIQAENFDLGGEGVAYHDLEAINQSGQYRTADGVDIEVTTDTGGGYNVDYTANGDWMEYTINVPTAGNYTLTERVASLTATQSFRVEFNGVNKTGTVVIPNTGGWQAWVNLSQTVNLSAGVQVMRIYFLGNDGNLNYISLSAASGPTPTRTRTPTPGPTATRTRTPTPGAIGVIFYQDINYGGVASGLKAKGDYAVLPGDVPNDWMSSLRVPPGWIVDAYADGNFTGAVCTYTADTSWVGTGCNDNMSSFRIR